METGAAPQEGSVPRCPMLLDQRALPFRTGARDPVGSGNLGKGEQRGDHAARAAREAALRPGFVRRPVGDHDRGAVWQSPRDVAAQRGARPSPLHALQECALVALHRMDHHGEGGGAGGDGDGDGEGDAEGDADGLALGDGLGEAEGFGVGVHDPGKNGSLASSPQPMATPGGRAYQSRMFDGSALTKRAMIVRPTFSPYAWISPPLPLGPVLPTQTPVTMSGLYAMIHESGIPPWPLSLVPVLLAI